MNEEVRKYVFKEVQDSVSRMIENLGFTAVERSAHNRLCDLLITDITVLSDSLRMFLENAGKSPSSMNAIDVVYTLKHHQFDLNELLEYTKEVIAFPPEYGHISPPSVKRDSKNEVNVPKIDDIRKKETVIVSENQKLSKRFEFPKFDDMDAFELGFAYHKPILQQKLPVSKPLNLKTNRPQNRIAEEFNNNYYTPLVSRQPVGASKSCHQLQSSLSCIVPTKSIQVGDTKPLSKPIPPTKSRSRLALWKRKMIERNHEQRLREEMMNQKEKELQINRKRLEEKRRLENSKALKKNYVEKNKDQISENEIRIKSNSNPKKAELESENCSVAKEELISGDISQPVLKMRVKFDRIDEDEIVVKRITTTRYRKLDGLWKGISSYKNIPSGVTSRTARNKGRKLSKLVLKKLPGGKFDFVGK